VLSETFGLANFLSKGADSAAGRLRGGRREVWRNWSGERMKMGIGHSVMLRYLRGRMKSGIELGGMLCAASWEMFS
jgi:hypothetical protein